MMFGRGFDGSCFNYGFNGLWHIILLLGITLIVIAVAVYIARGKQNKQINESALETLKMKYVLGEINEDEYLKKKDVLRK